MCEFRIQFAVLNGAMLHLFHDDELHNTTALVDDEVRSGISVIRVWT